MDLRLKFHRSLYFCLLLTLSSAGATAASNKKIDFQEPPFWMTSFAEFQDLRQKQKDFYVDQLASVLTTVPELKTIDKATLLQSAKKTSHWDSVMTEVYRFCNQSKNQKVCERIADTRLKTLETVSYTHLTLPTIYSV